MPTLPIVALLHREQAEPEADNGTEPEDTVCMAKPKFNILNPDHKLRRKKCTQNSSMEY